MLPIAPGTRAVSTSAQKHYEAAAVTKDDLGAQYDLEHRKSRLQNKMKDITTSCWLADAF